MSNARDKANIPALNFSSTGIDDNATSTAIKINTSQNVGIGTTSPQSRLHVRTADSGGSPITAGDELVVEGGAYNIGMSFLSTGGNGQFIYFGDDADNNIGSIKYEHGDNSFQFVTNASEAMRIDSSGNVGIGTSSPNVDLNVVASNGGNVEEIFELRNNSTTAGTGSRLRFTNSTVAGTTGNSVSISSYRNSDGDQDLLFETLGSERMRIESEGQVNITSVFDGTNFKVENTTHNAIMEIKATTANKNSIIRFADSASSTIGDIDYDHNDNSLSFTTNSSERMRIDSSGNVGIGTSSPTQPLQVEGIALSKPKLGMYSFGGGGAPDADRERARQGLWRASSDRGSFILASPVSNIDYNAFTTSTNNSYIVWDLLVTNCSEILVRILYANSADNSGRTCVSEYSVDGGSNYTQLGTATFNAGSGNCGGTISFSNTNYQNQTYVKIRTAFTSGAPPSSIRNYVGIKEVFFTPLCSSVSYQKCLG